MPVLNDFRNERYEFSVYETLDISRNGVLAPLVTAVDFTRVGGWVNNYGDILGRINFARLETSVGSASGVRNAGNIVAYSTVIEYGGAASGVSDPGFSLMNSGSIHGLVDLFTRQARIVNSGEMTSSGFAVIEAGLYGLRGAGSSIFNTGLIANLSPDPGQPGLYSYIAIGLADQNDLVVNSGLIIGDVRLGGGNDTFDGRGGELRGVVDGGAGNDLFIVDDPGLQIVEGSGQGRDTVEAWCDFVLPQHVEQLSLMGAAIRGIGNGQVNRIIGNAQDNVISGLGGNDELFGDLGNDTIFGGAGADAAFGGEGDDDLRGGAGNDSLLGQDGNDSLRGDAGNDSLDGGEGDDQLLGGAGNDSLWGGADEDLLRGGAGNDALDGGEGDDTVFGGEGNDTLAGNNGEDMIYGGAGRDRMDGGGGDDAMFGGAGFDTLRGGEGNDWLEGGTGNDQLEGGGGNDTIFGGAGDDVIIGGGGADLMDGGAGADVFQFRSTGDSSGSNLDTITGFQPGVDVVDLRGIDANAGLDGNQGFTFIGTAAFSGAAGELRFNFALNVREVWADTDGDRLADFVLIFDGNVNFGIDSFMI